MDTFKIEGGVCADLNWVMSQSGCWSIIASNITRLEGRMRSCYLALDTSSNLPTHLSIFCTLVIQILTLPQVETWNIFRKLLQCWQEKECSIRSLCRSEMLSNVWCHRLDIEYSIDRSRVRSYYLSLNTFTNQQST